MKHEAIYALYPNVVTIDDGAGAFDAQGKKVELDMEAVDAKAIKLDAEQKIKEQTLIDIKASALAKLAKLGLTQDEVKALVG